MGGADGGRFENIIFRVMNDFHVLFVLQPHNNTFSTKKLDPKPSSGGVMAMRRAPGHADESGHGADVDPDLGARHPSGDAEPLLVYSYEREKVSRKAPSQR